MRDFSLKYFHRKKHLSQFYCETTILLQGLYPTLGIDRALAVLGSGANLGTNYRCYYSNYPIWFSLNLVSKMQEVGDRAS